MKQPQINAKFPLTLEQLFTSPKLWNVPTATPVQRAKCRIFEGRPLGSLATHPDVLELTGVKGGRVPDMEEPPVEVLDISAIRIGKSLFGGAFLFWQSQVTDLSGTRDSDIVRLFVVALKIGGTAAVIKHLITPLTTQPLLQPYLVDDPKDITIANVQRQGLRIYRPHDKRIVEVVCIPLDRGGGSALSVYCAGLVVDEYPRMIGAEDGVRNVEHFRDGVQGRMLPGAIQLYTGSPWQPYGPAYDNTIKHFGNLGKPNTDLVVLRTSAKSFIGLGEWSEKKRARLERTNHTAYRTDFLAEFADGEEAVFPAQAIDDAITEPRPHIDDLILGRPAIFADPSALRRDFWACLVGAWALPAANHVEDIYETEIVSATGLGPYNRGPIISGRNGDWVRILEDEQGRPIPKKAAIPQKPFFKVFEIKSWDRNSGARGLDLVQAVSELARKYGCEDFHWDGYEQLMLGDLIRQQGLRPIIHTWSGANRKTQAVDHLRTLFVERRVQLPTAPPRADGEPTPAARLKTELQRFRSRPTPGGNFQYVVAGGAGHGDHASCLTLASRADLDGFLDRSPTAMPAERNEVYDYSES